jgi:DNA-binding PadR family transcriptional regulator
MHHGRFGRHRDDHQECHHNHDGGDPGCRHGREDDHRHARGDFWPGGHGPGFGPMRGGRMGRFFEHGDLRLVILSLIAEKPRHGYELIKAIEDRVGGVYSPSPGTIYPALTMLEEQGYLAVAASEGNKKLYTMTAEGSAYLAENRAVVDMLLGRMARANESQGGGPAPQIIRAVENLKLALRLRLSGAPLTTDQIRFITESLDRLAGEIERS